MSKSFNPVLHTHAAQTQELLARISELESERAKIRAELERLVKMAMYEGVVAVANGYDSPEPAAIVAAWQGVTGLRIDL